MKFQKKNYYFSLIAFCRDFLEGEEEVRRLKEKQKSLRERRDVYFNHFIIHIGNGSILLTDNVNFSTVKGMADSIEIAFRYCYHVLHCFYYA